MKTRIGGGLNPNVRRRAVDDAVRHGGEALAFHVEGLAEDGGSWYPLPQAPTVR